MAFVEQTEGLAVLGSLHRRGDGTTRSLCAKRIALHMLLKLNAGEMTGLLGLYDETDGKAPMAAQREV